MRQAVDAGESDQCSPENPQSIPESSPILKSLHAELAWTITKGEGIIVAVIDSGVSKTNSHLTDAVDSGANMVLDGEASEGWSDVHGHGTSVAGIIAGREVPGSGVIGLAPEARILPVRVYRDQEQESIDKGFDPDTARIAAGIHWAADKGAKIINVSMSVTENHPALEAAVRHADEKGSLVVASAGNTGTATDLSPDAPRYPASYPQVLGVAAVNQQHLVDESSFHGPQVDVAANGAFVLTSYFGGGDCIVGTDGASTSWATAYVSAAAALVAAKYPLEGPAEWRYRLMATASRPSPEARDDEAGWGLIQPYEALMLIDDGTAPGPPNPNYAKPEIPIETAPEIDLTAIERPLERTQSLALTAGILGFATVIALLLFARARPGKGASGEL